MAESLPQIAPKAGEEGEERELTIESFAFEGKSIARINGFVLFVHGAVPGETVRARIIKIKKTYGEAETIEILKTSPLRVQPLCPHFGVCGGCQWQHLSYDAQLALKHQNVVDAFERIGGFHRITVSPVIGAKEQYFYRNKMEFSFSAQPWQAVKETAHDKSQELSFALGLHPAKHFNKVIDIEKCFLQSEINNHILRFTKSFFYKQGTSIYSNKTHEGYLRYLVLREGKNTGERMVNLVTFNDDPGLALAYAEALIREVPEITTIVNTINSRRAQVAIGERENIITGPGYITEQLGKLRFRISPNSFFQTNSGQAEMLYRTVMKLAELTPKDVVYDLYAGTGTIGIFIAQSVSHVVGIEFASSAVRDARYNAQLNGIINCDFLEGDLLHRLKHSAEWMPSFPKPTVLIIDPPRSGMHPDVVKHVAQIGASRIVYVGCNPTTQARDIKALAERGYHIEVLQPIDLFPHTYHVENVALLRRNS